MKIEKLEFANLNSLVGSYTIDFTHPSLADAGMFIISGPTGAGKTTILDAIAYGLYGCTPRLQKGVSQQSNELMNRESAECMASVVFEVNGQRYRVTTEHRRAKARTETGKPFAQPKRTLARVENDGRTTTMETLVRRVDACVEQLTGLNFDNFTRCMMLAQGEFSRFLKAEGKDRANVLSTITGTEIYERIGQRVHERVDEQNKKLEALQMREVLPEDERAAKIVARDAAQKRSSTLKAGLDACREMLKWLAEMADYQKRCAAADAAATAAQKALADFNAGEEARLLGRARAAEKIAPLCDARNSALQTRLETDARLDALSAEIKKIAMTVTAAQSVRDATMKRHSEEAPRLEKEANLVREEILPLEKEMEGVRVRLESSRKSHSEALAACQKAEKAAAQAQQDREQHAKELEVLCARRNALLPDAQLPAHISLVESRLQDMREAAGEVSELLSLPAAQEAVRANATQQEALLQGGTRETLTAELQSLEKLQHALAERNEAAELCRRAQEKLSAAETLQRELPALEETEQRLSDATAHVDKLRSVCDIQEQLADLYERFRRHEFDTCPCCGSATPGAAPARVEDSMLNEAREKKKALENECAELKKKHASAREAISAAKARVETAEQLLSKRENALQDLVNKRTTPIPEKPAEDICRIKASLQRLSELEEERAELERRLAFAERCDIFVQVVRPFAVNVPANMTEAQELTVNLRKRAEAYEQLLAGIDNAQNCAAKDSERCAQSVRAAEEAQKKSEETASALKTVETEWSALCDKRAKLGNPEESADAALKRIDAAQKKLADALQQAETALSAAMTQQTEKRAEESELKGHRASAEKLLVEALVKLQAALKEQGFENETAFGAARSGIARIPEWEARLESLKEAQNKASAAAQALHGEMERCAARALTTEAEEVIRERQDATAQQLKESDEVLETLNRALAIDDAARATNREIETLRQQIVAERDRWQLLFTVLGGKKEGFKQYAQQITFDCLIASANMQLRNLNDRYELFQGPGDDFALYVIDRWTDDENGRSCANLSGGESFVVSLALALGLSSLSGSDTSIDTLFLDEGFGTLDPDTLERVLSSLEKLRAEGRLIGIISHVNELKERLPVSARLEVTRAPSSAISIIAPHPAVTSRKN